jgi:hypothetical protein
VSTDRTTNRVASIDHGHLLRLRSERDPQSSKRGRHPNQPLLIRRHYEQAATRVINQEFFFPTVTPSRLILDDICVTAGYYLDSTPGVAPALNLTTPSRRHP